MRSACLSLVLLAAMSGWGCRGSQGGGHVGTESHFLSPCAINADCPSLLSCISERCTVSCESDDECTSLADDALCLETPDGSRGRSCDRALAADPTGGRGGAGTTAGSGPGGGSGGRSGTAGGSAGDGATPVSAGGRGDIPAELRGGSSGSVGAAARSAGGSAGTSGGQGGFAGSDPGGLGGAGEGGAAATNVGGPAGAGTTTILEGSPVAFEDVIHQSVAGFADSNEAYVVSDEAAYESLASEFGLTTPIDFSTHFAIVLRYQNSASLARPHIAEVARVTDGYEVLVSYEEIEIGTPGPQPGYEIHIVSVRGTAGPTTFTFVRSE